MTELLRKAALGSQRTDCAVRLLPSRLLKPSKPDAMIVNPLDSIVQLPLDPVESVGMLIEDSAVLAELRLDGVKSTGDLPKPLPYLFLEGLEPVRYHRSERIDSHSFTRHSSPL